MDESINVACPICFAMPGEACIEKYIVWGGVNVTPVVASATHGARIVDGERANWHLSQKAPQ